MKNNIDQPSIQKRDEAKMTELNKRLLHALSNSTGKSKNPAGMLQSLLNIGKDAAYRRLRGEVSFTLDELSIICNRLDICLDAIIYGAETGKAIFDLEETLPGKKEYEVFMQRLEMHTKIWKSESNTLIAACPSLPEFIMLRFPKFSKFRLFAIAADLNTPFSEFIAPKSFKNTQLAYNMAFSEINSLELIFDDNLLNPFVKEIGYFARLGILSSEEASELLKELLLITDVLENMASSGTLPGTKVPVNTYLSHTGIGTEIWLLENEKGNNTAWLSPYPGKSIRTQNKNVCKNHKIRIDEIKRFSTFITRSGEMVRREFFPKLREGIKQQM